MKFICNIPLNVTKYINNVKKKKVKSIRKLLKNCIHYTHMQPKKHNIWFMCVSSEMSENDNCKSGLYQKPFSTITKYTHLISTHSSQTEIEVTTI